MDGFQRSIDLCQRTIGELNVTGLCIERFEIARAIFESRNTQDINFMKVVKGSRVSQNMGTTGDVNIRPE